MSNLKRGAVLVSAVLGTFACSGPDGGGESGAPSAATSSPRPSTTAGGASMPTWFRVEGNEIEIDIVAGATSDANYWNFNGAFGGNMTITVPEGARVTINFRNADPVVTHSIGVGPVSDSPPASPAPQPVFEGAMSSNPTSMAHGTGSNESETLTFTASQAGQYALLCYIPGHAITGMWVRFDVGGEPGVAGAPDVQIMD